MGQIAKGEKRTLNVTDQGSRRFFVGLSWDPSPEKGFKAKIIELLSHQKTFQDLDLFCFIYNSEKECLGVVSGKAEDDSLIEAIYHSGDDPDGSNSVLGDDEQISVELANLSDDVHHIVFKAAVLSGDPFSEIASASLRMVDGYSDHHFSRITLDGSQAAYVFVEVFRENDQWILHGIHTYEDRKSVSKWKDYLKAFLSRV